MFAWNLKSLGAILAAALVGAPSFAYSAAPPGRAHALVIGIDSYAHLTPLQGGVADARDIVRSLREIGVQDMQVLLDKNATRSSVLTALDSLTEHTHSGDTIYLTISAYGAKMPMNGNTLERSVEDVYLLGAFDPVTPEGASEKIRQVEIRHTLSRLEAAGAHVLFVEDTGFGTELARDVDPRGTNPSYRTASISAFGKIQASDADAADAKFQASDFKHVFWLSAVPEDARAPEVVIPGIGFRGALSYAFARALEGAADEDKDGMLTTLELFSYVHQVAHELSDQRQNVTLRSSDENPVFKLGDIKSAARGISVRPVGAPAQKSVGFTIVPADVTAEGTNDLDFGVTPAAVPSSSMKQSVKETESLPAGRDDDRSSAIAKAGLPASGSVIKLASLDNNISYFGSLQQQEPVKFVAPNAMPDLVWDPNTHDVLAGADIIARNVDPNDIAGVVERSLLLSMLKEKSTKASQQIVLLPSDNLHTKGARIEIEVGQLMSRYLVLFNVSGNGSAQLLYPLGSDNPQRQEPTYNVQLQIREPFGADALVAVTSSQRLVSLERLLKQSARRLSPDRLAEELGRVDGQNLRVGYVGLFTAP